MKKFLLLFSFLGLLFAGGAAIAQPVLSYPGNTTANNYTLPVGTAITTQTPSVSGTPVGTFAAATNFATITTPAGIVYDAVSGGFYVVDYQQGNVYSITTGGTVATVNNSTLTNNTATSITVDGSGNIYVTDGTTLREFNAAGNNTATVTGFNNAAAVTYDPVSNLIYVADSGNGLIYKVTPGATTKTALGIAAFSTPLGIAVDASGNIFVSQTTVGTDNVIKVANGTTGGTGKTTFASGFSSPRNLTTDAYGNVYVADNGNNAIKRISAAGTVVTLISTGLNQPRMVDFDASGNMYEADEGSGRIKEFVGTYYSYTGILPPGLSFDPLTGNITGTPNTGGSYSIIVKAASTSGNGTVTVNFTCVALTATDLTGASLTASSIYEPQANIAVAGISFATNTSTTTLSKLVFTVSPSDATAFNYFANPPTLVTCPTGTYSSASQTAVTTVGSTFTGTTFTFNISPTVTISTTTKYFFLVLNYNVAGGATPQVFTFNPTSYTSALGTVTPSYTANTYTCIGRPILTYAASPYTYVQGATPTISISNSGGAVTSAYVETGTLPTGITFSTANGQFSIASNATIGTYSFTVNASNPAGSSSSAAAISITINPPAPVITYAPNNANTWLVGTNYSISPNTSGGGAVSTWSYTGTLPPGVTFDYGSGTISGNPNTPGSYSVSVTGTNVTASNSRTVTFTVDYPNPIISYSPSNPYSSGATISLAVTNSEAAVTTGYTFTGTLPAGVTLSGSTGTISGTLPTVSSSTAATYTVTVTASTGSSTGSTSVSIIINPNPPAFTYGTPNAYTVNVAHSTLSPSPVAGSGAVAAAGTYTGTTILTSAAGNGSLVNPYGMAVDASGNVYVVNDNGASSTVTEYSTAGAITVHSASIPSGAIGIVFDSSGNAYVLGQTSKSVVEFSGGLSGTASTIITGLTTPTGIAYYGAANTLYIADSGTNNIKEYSTSGASGTIITPPNNIFGSGVANVSGGVAVDASGNVYVADNAYDFLGSGVDEYNPAGGFIREQVLGSVFAGTTISGLYIDGSGNIYVTDTGGNTGTVYAAGFASTVVQETGFNTPRGIVADQLGNFYVSDYSNKTVTKYAPASGYFLSGPLPPGLSFNTTNGQITGTATAAFPTTNYTVTAYNSGGEGTSNIFTITCTISFDWVGTQTGGDWNTAANWESLTVPGSGDQAKIGVNVTFTHAPVVSTTGATTVTVGSVLLGNAGGQTSGITVNTGRTLVVVGDITAQSDANSTLGYISYLSGFGTVQAVNLNIIANTALASAYSEQINSSVTSLQLSGNVAITSTKVAHAANAKFSVSGGVTSLTGTGASGIISTSNQTGSTSTIAVSAGTLQWANATGLSGLSSVAGSNILSFTGTGIIGYSGANQTVYTDLPVTGLASGVSYQGISFSGTGIKTPNGTNANNLNIAGSFTNSLANDAADNVSLANTIVNFNGTTAQALAGGTASQTYGTIFNTVNFSNAGVKTMSGNFYVAATGTLTMSSSASLVAGDNATSPTTADAYLTLLSNATNTAAIAPIVAGTSISGNVNVQRYISAIRGYRLISSPVYAGTANGNNIYSLNSLLNNLYLTGTGGGFTAPGNPTLYLYDEGFAPQFSTFLNSNFIGVADISSGTGATPSYLMNVNGSGGTVSTSTGYNIPAGNGFYCFFRGNLSEGSANLTNPSYPASAATITATGNLTQGQVNFADWYTPTSTYLGGISQNFNLVGNPYASAIDLSKVTGTNNGTGIYATPYNTATNTGVTTHIYELNPVTNIYGVYTDDGSVPPTNGATQYIASGQGFFVQAFGANAAQLVFNEDAKATSANANAPGLMARRTNLAAINTGSVNPLLDLKMSLDSVQNEETLLSFDANAHTSYVVNEDAPHRTGGGLVGFASMSSDNIPMSINTMPLRQTQTIPLRVYATNDGIYSINLSALRPLPALYEVWLKDAFMKDSLDIKSNPVYRFNIANADTSTYGAYRLSLVIRENPALMIHLLSFGASKIQGGDQVIWTTENEQNYTNFTVERSTDGGTTFNELSGFLSTAQSAYSYLDKVPVNGPNMYRLKIVDLNGTVTYSNVVTIMYANTGGQIAINGMMVYPNPTANMINLSITNNTTNGTTTGPATNKPSYNIEIVNNLGSVIKAAKSSSPLWQSDVTSLTPGTYFIRVIDTGNNTVVGRSAFVKL